MYISLFAVEKNHLITDFPPRDIFEIHYIHLHGTYYIG